MARDTASMGQFAGSVDSWHGIVRGWVVSIIAKASFSYVASYTEFARGMVCGYVSLVIL